MATIRVKRTTGITPPSGLTFGELAFVGGITSFYATNNLGQSIRVGAQVDTDTTLAADSDNRIPTQKATKAYVDAATEESWKTMSAACLSWWKENVSVEGSFNLTKSLVEKVEV
jgi:large exoprotein involved in heme utilization and adhesion